MSRKNETEQIEKARETLAQGDLPSARALLQKLLKAHPGNADGLFMLGHVYMREGNFEKARKSLEQAVAIKPTAPDYLNALGVLMFMMHQYTQAEATFYKALELSPSNMEIIGNLGILLRHMGNHDEALNCLRAVRMNGRASLKILEELGEELMRQNELPRARELFTMIKKEMPDNVNALTKLGMIRSVAGDWEGAEQEWRKALSADPNSAETYSLRGVALMNRGQMDEAIASIEKALTLQPGLAGANIVWAHLVGESDAASLSTKEVYENVKTAIDVEGIPFDDWANLGFAAGKLASQLKLYDAAFEYYDRANKAIWQRFPMPEEYYTHRTQAIIDAFDEEFFAKKSKFIQRSPVGNDRAGEGLVFVFGMPRSGTTLGEHILARSTMVLPGGERSEIEDIFEKVFSFSDNPAQLTTRAAALDLATIRKIATRYHEHVGTVLKDRVCFVDKTPRNYMWLGFLATIFPRAKFIHCVRNPVDTCLSCYINYFILHSQKFSYDLVMLGKVHNLYREIMAHWRHVLPVPVYDLIYEEVVSSPEEQIRAYTDFCDLDWDESFLETGANQHTVMTASVAQVRKPIYSGSVDRWRRYEAHLAPLLRELGQI